MNKIKLLTDQAIGEGKDQESDGLGFKTYAQVLGDAALETPGPFTIGIFGEWGTGKTSLMRMIEKQLSASFKLTKQSLENLRKEGIPDKILEGLKLLENQGFTDEKEFLNAVEKQIGNKQTVRYKKLILKHAYLSDKNDGITVWFNPWRFEKEEHPIIPLIATIVKTIEQRKTFRKKYESLVRALRSFIYGFSAQSKLKIPGFAEIEASLVAKDMIDRTEKLAHDPLLDQSLYYQAFDVLSEVSRKTKPRIIVFIDDLDRCLPDQAINLLESIKLILSQPGFVFFIGVARSIIEGYLEHLYKDEYGLEEFQDQAAYLDKIVQLPFYIPPHRGRMKDFSEKLLQGLEDEDQKAFREILEIIGVACGSNPRSTIRFVNNLLIDRAINRSLAEMQEIPISYFAITRSLQQRWPDVFVSFVTSPDLCSTIADWDRDDISNLAATAKDYGDQAVPFPIQIATKFNEDKDLHTLIYSKQGIEWLKKESIRQEAIQFLGTQRKERESEYDVFLSYHSQDHEIISRIATILKANDKRVFLDSQIQFEENVTEALNSVFKKTQILAVFVGSRWDDSKWTQERLLQAMLQVSHRGLILPVLLPGADIKKLPPFLQNCPLIDFQEHQEINEETLKPLMNALFI